MKMNEEYIIVPYNHSDYKINVKKLEAVLSILEQKVVKIKSDKDCKLFLRKYKLYDEGFFKNINKI